jgi:hypothetical protein
MAGREIEEFVITPASVVKQMSGWQPGDVVLDDRGEFWTRASENSIRQGWPWHRGADSIRWADGRPHAPEGGSAESEPARPLTSIARAGRLVDRCGCAGGSGEA